jgi:hypothetical protein
MNHMEEVLEKFKEMKKISARGENTICLNL